MQKWISFTYVLIFALLGMPPISDTSSDNGHVWQMPICQAEDGNSDGKPCLWIDPTDGIIWYVSSEEYTNENDDPNTGMTGQR